MPHSKNPQDAQIKTILITGGCGFIGTNLINYLPDKNYQIRVLD